MIFEIVRLPECDDDERIIPPKLFFWIYISYIVLACGFLIPKILAFLQMKENGGSDDYNCSDPIANEVIRVGNENNKKIFAYNKICLFSDIAILSCNFLVVIVGLLWDIIAKIIKNNNPNDVQKEQNKTPEVEIPFASYRSDN